MSKSLLKYFIYLIILSGVSQNVSSQTLAIDNNSAFYFDAVIFKGTDDSSRIDAYTLIPYQTLSFIKANELYKCKYKLEISVFDTNSQKICSRTIEKTLTENDYASTTGANGKFDHNQTILQLPKGNYTIKAVFTDLIQNSDFEKSRILSIIDYKDFQLSTSGILLVSSIEDKNGKYIITPHVSDNIGNLKEGFFAFFEVYNQGAADSVDFFYEIAQKEDKILSSGSRQRKYIKNGKNQIFMKIPRTAPVTGVSTYTLTIKAVKTANDSVYTEKDLLAVSQRTIKILQTVGGIVLADLDKAVKQLRFVASGQDIEYIEEAKNQTEKQERFEAYWKTLDPTLGTERNEAFDEYYLRIDYANKTFKSFSEGWFSDKGMVYIIFGQPNTVERSNSNNDGRIYERWTYYGGREFVFVDNSGLGDFRLYRPMAVTERYRYSN